LGRVNAGLPGTIEMQALRFSLLGGTVRMENAVLKSADDRPIAGFQALDLSWQPRALLLGAGVRIDSIRVSRPWCRLEIMEGNGINLAQALSKSTTAAPPASASAAGLREADVTIKQFAVTQGAFAFADPGRAVAAEINGIDLTAGMDLKDRRADLRLEASEGCVTVKGGKLPVDRLTISAHLSNNAIQDLSMVLTNPYLQASLSGKADNLFDSPVLDLGHWSGSRWRDSTAR
jgi:hypothetical protein